MRFRRPSAQMPTAPPARDPNAVHHAQLATVSRNIVEGPWPNGDTEPFTRTFDHSYTVEQFGNVAPGVDVSPVQPAAAMHRGELVRSENPTGGFRLPNPVPMYDPTDPAQWRPNL